MNSYYTSIMILCWMALGSLGILVYRNNRLPGSGKKLLYLTYALVAVSALAEWCGVLLDGRADLPRWLLRTVKCADYILTPMAGGALVMQMNLRNHWQKAISGILAANTLFQLVSLAGDWVLIIDGENHYSHGPLFPLYFAVCLAIYTLIILQFVVYGRSFKRQNRSSLYAIMAVVIVGIALQELLEGVRTAYLGMTLGAALMFIHYSEFSQMRMDEYIDAQRVALDTDPLTELYSRYAYSQALKEYSDAEDMPEELAAFSIDINGLKTVNDRLGHEAGDELICGAARCIEKVFGRIGSYRTGGDEFIVLARGIRAEQAEANLVKLEQESRNWKGSKGQVLQLSAGYALAKENPTLNAEALVGKADMAMYAAKSQFYRNSGYDRRKAR